MTLAVNNFRLQLKFWGVRGSTPTPNAANLGYGGNTTCLEILSPGGERIIVDAGTGICNLGRGLVNEPPSHTNLFLTHFHWDHIQGIPFFAPMLQPGNKVTFYSFPPSNEIRKRLEQQMSSPYFTLQFDSIPSSLDFVQLDNTAIRRGDLSVTPFPLHHPQGASGYRIECQGASIVVATDMEHGNPDLDKVLLEQAEGADLLIYDAQYTPAEYASRHGWGHSTYADAARFARDAQVKQLMLFHHDPTRSDTQIDALLEQVRQLFENVAAAREQCTITL